MPQPPRRTISSGQFSAGCANAAATYPGSASPAGRLFAAFLGAAAGNFALSCGTRAGIYFAGGVLPKLGDRFDRDLCLRRFRDKGRFESYLRDVPLWLLTRPDAAFVGMLAHLIPVERR